MSKALDPKWCFHCDSGKVKDGRCQNGDCGAIYGIQAARGQKNRRRVDMKIDRTEMVRLRRVHPVKNDRRHPGRTDRRKPTLPINTPHHRTESIHAA